MSPSNEQLVAGGQGRDPESLLWSAWICGICFIGGMAIVACAIVHAAARQPEPAPPSIHLPPPVVHVEPAAVTVENRVQSPAITVQASKVEPSIFIEPAPVYVEAPQPSVVLLTEQIPPQASKEILESGAARPVHGVPELELSVPEGLPAASLMTPSDIEAIARRVAELEAERFGTVVPAPKK